MRASIAFLAMLSFVNSVRCGDADRNSNDQEQLRSYMVGEYELIGRKPDSTVTYSGHVRVRNENGTLRFTRTIQGVTEHCFARLDTVAGGDRIPVLRTQLHMDGKAFEATYRWQSDPDNYPRFTGYVYLTGTKSPGLEALFPLHQ
jgi:hypothetical protein